MNVAADALSAALVHSLWQDAALGILLWTALLFLRHRSANARYLACCAALALMVALPIATAIVLYARATPRAAPLPALASDAAAARSSPLPSVEVPPPASAAAGRADWIALVQAWSLPVWSVGALLFSLRLVPAGLHTVMLRRRASPATRAIECAVSGLAARIGIRRAVSVRVSAATSAPATIGFLRPMILLPPATLLGVPPEQLQALLAHELAHVRRHDYLVNVLQMLAETLLFHHPAVWWASRRIRIERELCCDDIAVEACGDPIVYAHALSSVARQGLARPRLAVGSADGPLLRRIQRVLGVATSTRPVSPVWAVGACAVLVPLLLAGAGAQAPRPGTIAPRSEEASVLRGRVVDARTGTPVAGASVRAQYITGVERPTRCPIGDCEDVVDPRVGRIPVYRATADANGRFEMAGMRPGEYLVAAAAPGYVQAYFGQSTADMPEVPIQVSPRDATEPIRIPLQTAGAIAGRVLSEGGEGLPGVEVELLRRTYLRGGAQAAAVEFAQTGETGAFSFSDVTPGEYYLRAYAPASLRPEGADAAVAYVSTFLPGVAEQAFAQPVIVGSGGDLAGLDFVLATARTRVVSGRLVDPAGASAATATVHLFPRPSGPNDMLRAAARPDGTFRFDAVPPGDYMLVVSDGTPGRSWNAAVRDISIAEDVTELQLVASPTVSLEGRIAAESSRAIPFDLSDLQIFTEQRHSDLGTHSAGFAKVSSDGRFSMKSGTGVMSVRIVGLPRGWFVSSVRLDGADVTDAAFDLAPGAKRLDIQLTDLVGRLEGRVTDGGGRPLTNAMVIAFPADRARWINPDAIRTTYSYEGGRYALGDLPIAEYRVVAVTALPRNAWTDPEVLARLWPSGTGVWLDRVGQRTVNLDVVRPPADLLP